MSTLYSTELLALAADIPHLGRLATPTGAATCRSPVCGSTVSAEVEVTDGRIIGFAQEVRACLLGQASAALLGRAVLGATPDMLQTALHQVEGLLAGGLPPAAPFDGYALLSAAQDHPARHAAILLPLRAAALAAEKSRQP